MALHLKKIEVKIYDSSETTDAISNWGVLKTFIIFCEINLNNKTKIKYCDETKILMYE